MNEIEEGQESPGLLVLMQDNTVVTMASEVTRAASARHRRRLQSQGLCTSCGGARPCARCCAATRAWYYRHPGRLHLAAKRWRVTTFLPTWRDDMVTAVCVRYRMPRSVLVREALECYLEDCVMEDV